MALFHFSWWIIFHYLLYAMWTLDSGLTDVRDRPVSMKVLSWWGLNHNSPEESYLMFWASGKNSSSDTELLITFTATSSCPFHLFRWTAPNWPLPSSFNRVISSLRSFQIPSEARQTHFGMRTEGFGAKNFTHDSLQWEFNSGKTKNSTFFFKLLSLKKKPLVMWS